jgi:hypothetical protein
MIGPMTSLRCTAAVLVLLAAGCSGSGEDARLAALEARVNKLESQPVPSAVAAEAARAGYTPGLGEIMGLNQIRHEKLWFAGSHGNWPLASYELDEIQEGLEDAVKYNPTHEGVPEPLTVLVPRYTSSPMQQLRKAVEAKDRAAFEKAFDGLTAGCNSCHQAANFGFNVVQRPTTVPFTNQLYTKGGK